MIFWLSPKPTHIFRMLLIVKKDLSLDPREVGLFSANGIVLEA
jgi:hypothetical protein